MTNGQIILVTGAAGFIGCRTALDLLNSGHRVVGFDNINDYYPTAIKHARLAELTQHGGDRFIMVEGDLCDRDGLSAVFKEHRPERVCHLAAQAGVRHSIDHPHDYQSSNLEGMLNILECCRRHETPRLVYASSSSVYGRTSNAMFTETDMTDSPVSLYGATKKANELMAYAYSDMFGLNTIGLRFFTVYGPWGRPDMGIWIFTEKILDGVPIPVFNNGKMKRDFTYIDDIVSGVSHALFRDGLDTFDIFNLGNHRSVDLLDLIHIMETALDTKAELQLLPMQQGDIVESFANIDHARDKLGFDPATGIETGVGHFCDWYKGHPDLADIVREWRAAPARA